MIFDLQKKILMSIKILIFLQWCDYYLFLVFHLGDLFQSVSFTPVFQNYFCIWIPWKRRKSIWQLWVFASWIQPFYKDNEIKSVTYRGSVVEVFYLQSFAIPTERKQWKINVSHWMWRFYSTISTLSFLWSNRCHM